MCGIIFTNQSNCNQYLKITQHRGPDESKIIQIDSWYLGFNRLAFQDLSRSAGQPMEFSDRYFFLFNGEIYNKDELKSYLNIIDNFKTSSDTEVLLRFLVEIVSGNISYKFYEKIDGIFSFLLFDKLKNKIFFSRDKFGVKPLYLINNSKEFSVFSDYSFFNYETSINDNLSLGTYLKYPFSFDSVSLFKDIQFVPVGKIFSADLSSRKIHIEYQFNHRMVNSRNNSTSLKNNLISSLEGNLVGDYEAAYLLSGGVDSSLLVSLKASKDTQKKIKTYSVNFLDDSNSERDNQFLVIKKYPNIENKNVLIDQSIFFRKLSDYIINTKKLPIIPNEIALFILFEKIKDDGFRLVISGEGADEIFDGYAFISDAIKINFLKSLNVFGKLLIRVFNWFGKGLRFNNLIKNPLDLFDNILISEDNFLSSEGKFNIVEIKKTLLEQYLYGLLQRVDNASMRNSIEVRVPFLSNAIYYNYFRKPSTIKNLLFPTKIDLRLILASLVSCKLAFSPKKGFGLPWFIWYRANKDLKRIWHESINSSFIRNLIKKNNIDITFDSNSDKSTNLFFDRVGFRIICIYIIYKQQNSIHE